MSKISRKEQKEAELDEIFAKLDDLDRAIIRVKLEKPAITNVDLGLMFEVNEHKIGKRVKKDKVIKSIAELQKKAVDILIDLQCDSARYLGTVVRDTTEKTVNRIRASREILKGVLSENVNVNMFSEEIQDKLKEIRDKYADSPDVE